MEILALLADEKKYAKLKSTNFSNFKILKCLKFNGNIVQCPAISTIQLMIWIPIT